MARISTSFLDAVSSLPRPGLMWLPAGLRCLLLESRPLRRAPAPVAAAARVLAAGALAVLTLGVGLAFVTLAFLPTP